MEGKKIFRDESVRFGAGFLLFTPHPSPLTISFQALQDKNQQEFYGFYEGAVHRKWGKSLFNKKINLSPLPFVLPVILARLTQQFLEVFERGVS